MVVMRSDGREESIAYRELRQFADDRVSLQVGRRDRPGWKLQLSGHSAAVLRDVVPKARRRLRWGAARAWHIAIFVGTLLIVELVKLPAEWTAPLIPRAVEHRLVPASPLTSPFGKICISASGERVIRRLIARFDPAVARRVKIEVVYESAFQMSAMPGQRLIIYKPFLTEIEPDEFAALLAHEVAHLQGRDAVEAVLRVNTLPALAGLLFGANPGWALEFSDEDEGDADRRALAMLMSAGISPLPGAALFDRMERARVENTSFGKEQYYLHPGFVQRARVWRDWFDKGGLTRTAPAVTREEAEALFNYCWPGITAQGPPASSPKPSPPALRR